MRVTIAAFVTILILVGVGFLCGLFTQTTPTQIPETVTIPATMTIPTTMTQRVRPTKPSPTVRSARATATAMATSTPVNDNPATALATPAPVTDIPPTGTAIPPVEGANWISNGKFLNQNFGGWQDTNGYWSSAIHAPIRCDESGSWYLQMDTIDPHGSIGWPGAVSEDTAWTDFVAPITPSVMTIRWQEAHHLGESTFEVSVLGKVSNNNGGEWDVLFSESGAHSPSGTGKCLNSPPALVERSFPVEKPYLSYRLVVSGKIVDQRDAYLMGNISITGK
jgi:hypothetical protein